VVVSIATVYSAEQTMPTTLTCDDCDKTFETDVGVGEKVRCPFCDDVNVVRASDQSGRGGEIPLGRAGGAAPVATPGDRASEAGLPAKSGPEVDVLALHPAVFRASPFGSISLIVIVVGGGVAAGVFAATIPPAAILCGVIALIALCTLVYWKLTALTESFRITTRRVIDRTGLFSKHTSEVLIKDIRNVVVTQTFWQRLWKVGTLSISSAADDGAEISMNNVPDPEYVKKVIDLYR
jgi:hypothetical protein